jgi:hypothetical protein
MNFSETDAGEVKTQQIYSDPTIAYESRGGFKDFFSRPIEIFTTNWAEGTSLTTSFINPWALYFGSNTIAPKLKGYGRIRARLHIKVLVNGSPFRYGAAMLSYRHLYNRTDEGINSRKPTFSGGQIAGDTINTSPVLMPTSTVATELMARSQRPNLMILPHLNKGGEMVLPFVYYKDAISLPEYIGAPPVAALSNQSYVAMLEMGTLILQNVADLRSTASAQTTPVNINIYAWAEDVELWGPTYFAAQGEFEDAAASKPSAIASTIAAVAGSLTWVPIIGTFAKATEMAASTASSILKLFGWSNPPIISGIHAMIPRIGFTNPTPIMSIQDDVLALDPKNEVTIDPRTVGCEPHDELVVDHWCRRDAIIDRVQWQATDTHGTTLLMLPVSPCHFIANWVPNTSVTNAVPCGRVTMTPATYAAQMFDMWRGDMVVTLQIVASQFHRGRLAITWDPVSTGSAPAAAYNAGAMVTEVIDLATSDTVELKIPYLAATGMLGVFKQPLQCYSSANCNWQAWGNRSTSSSWVPNVLEGCANGCVYVQVMNQLQCGDVTADVTIVVKTRFENMVLAMPSVDYQQNERGNITNVAFANFAPQGLEEPDDTSLALGSADTGAKSKLALLYAGENVPSLRSLLHRSYIMRYKHQTVSGSATYSRTLIYTGARRFPVARNMYSGQPATDTISSLSFNDNSTTPIQYLTACFTGYRGSIVWRTMVDKPSTTFGALTIGRGATYDTGSISMLITDVTDGQYRRTYKDALTAGQNGVVASHTCNNGSVSAVFPMYSNYRMFPANMTTMYYQANSTMSERAMLDNDYWHYTVTVNGPASSDAFGIYTAASCGADFSLFGFVNCPDIYVSSITR